MFLLSNILLLGSRFGFKPVTIIRSSSSNATNAEPVLQHHPKTHGSYHWGTERALSLVSLPLVTGALAFGPVPAIDFALGFVIPLHCYFGFESMIVDYLPPHRAGFLNTVALWTARIATVFVVYGCYVINTADVGLTALTKRLWTGK